MITGARSSAAGRSAPTTRCIRASADGSPGTLMDASRTRPRSLLVDLAERFLRDPERVDGRRHAGVDRDLEQHLADLVLSRAVADRAFDVDLELVRAVQRAQHRDV